MTQLTVHSLKRCQNRTRLIEKDIAESPLQTVDIRIIKLINRICRRIDKKYNAPVSSFVKAEVMNRLIKEEKCSRYVVAIQE